MAPGESTLQFIKNETRNRRPYTNKFKIFPVQNEPVYRKYPTLKISAYIGKSKRTLT